MNIVGRFFSVATVAVIAFAALYGVSQVRQVATVTLEEEKPFVDVHPKGIVGQNLGSAGCMGAACHGGPAAKALAGKIDSGTWQSSGSCWVAADPHASAYAVLTTTKEDQRAGRIKVSAEHIMERYASDTPGARATEDVRCLACHTNPTLADTRTDPQTVSLRAEGVSCEACHGSAGGWIRQHTTWTGKRDKVYEETGMRKLYDLGERALACAGCHIGAPEAVVGTLPDGTVVKSAVRDMNHDMIAAGHPRLNFDFAEYQRRLPAHWQEKDRDTTDKDGKNPPRPVDPVKAWLVGRVAHAEAACQLLDDRAKRAANDPRTPWPEFAEYNCAACHHNLRAPKGAEDVADSSQWRVLPAVLGARPPGSTPWQAVWPLTPAIGLNPQSPEKLFGASGDKSRDAIKQLTRVMQSARMPGSARVQGEAKAGDAAAALGALRLELVGRGEQKGWTDGQCEAEAKKVFTGFTPGAQDWDSGLQLLFGLAALERRRDPPERRDGVFRDAFGAYRGSSDTELQRWRKMQEAIQKLYPNN